MSLEQYIRQAAQARGINPDIAVRVAKGEGGLQNPFRHGEGPAPRSQAAGLGGTENSFGPFQLYVSGTGAGLGDRALAAGIDPSKDWQGGVNFALDEVKNKGWGQWYGAKAQGITGMMGVGGNPAPDGPKGQESYPILGPQTTAGILGGPQGGPLGVPTDVGEAIGSILSGPDEGQQSPLQKMFAVLANTPNAPAPRLGPMGDARQTGDALLKALSAPKFADTLLSKRMG